MDIWNFCIGYFVIAGLAALIIYVRNRYDHLSKLAKYSEGYSKSAEAIGGFIAALIWPVGLFIGVIDALRRLSGHRRARLNESRLQQEKRRIENMVGDCASELDPAEREALVGHLVEIAGGDHERFDRLPENVLTASIEGLWQCADFEAAGIKSLCEMDDTSTLCSRGNGVQFSETRLIDAPKEDWGFHMTSDFRKSVKDLDKSMRGRVLDAITEICLRPMEVRGDTVKPLTGELSGCWRYRLGDYRLIYQPIVEVHRIDLITIGGRGSVYVH